VSNLRPQKPTPSRTALYLAAILVVAFLARLAFAWDQEQKIPRDALAIVPFAQETGNIAYSLAHGQGFSSPFRNNTGPTAWLVPVYPFLLSIIFRLFDPDTVRALNAAVLLNSLLSAAACVPIFSIGRRIGGIPAALLAAAFWALLPSAIMLPFEWIWDTSLSALLAAILLAATLRVAESQRARDWCAYGLLWGFALLSNAALGSLLLPWLAWAGYRRAHSTPQPENSGTPHRRSADHRWKLPLLALAIAILCCLPWTVRNYVEFHKLIPLRSNFSFELWSGNNNIFDPHTGNAMARITLYGEVRQYTQLGETAYMQDKWRKATLFIRTHPLLESKLFLARIISTWMGTQRPWNDFLHADSWLPRLVFAVNALLLLGTLAGIVLLYRRRSAAAFPLAIAPLVFPIVYYITHTSLRYRHPLDPVLVILTAFSLISLFNVQPSPPRTAQP
jgi:hypothetical protein